ncbi:MAG: hypothetical protein WA709_26615 [Stellaceae bacterium]
MLDKDDVEPLVEIVEAFTSASSRADRENLLAQIRSQLEKLRAGDEKLQAKLGEFHDGHSEGGVGLAEAEQAASILREEESVAARILLPRILSLQRYLTGTSLNDEPEAHQLLQKAVDIAVGYVAGYQNLRDQVIRRGAARGAAVNEVLRARPVTGEIDYAELSREHIARYPKIRAALAE